ncbi:hypothetical protein [Microbacterium sp. NPDC058389]|uniref:hypothetical protein n=1 Tax=Microbacterium sp. NPDC058389 TaxID=3346475 RepID=UPI00365BB5C1
MSAPELPEKIQSAADVDAWADYVRERVTPVLDGGFVRDPDWVIYELEKVSGAAAVMVVVVRDADKVRRATARTLAKAKAREATRLADARVPQVERSARVIAATEDEADADAIARASYDYAKAVAGLVDDRMSAVQTIGKQVLATYSGGA